MQKSKNINIKGDIKTRTKSMTQLLKMSAPL